jgi:hypothetical protein
MPDRDALECRFGAVSRFVTIQKATYKTYETEEFRVESESLRRAFAFAASCARFFGAAFDLRECRSLEEISAISSTASKKGPSFAFDGWLNPLIFLTNWSEAARISSAVTGGEKLKSVLIFLHIPIST